MQTEIAVRDIEPPDYPDWLRMWRAYCAFYETDVSAAVTASTWHRIIARDAGVYGLLAVGAATGEPLGFANYVVHPFTWSERPACYLEDLFVRAERRGGGVGRTLIDALVARGGRSGWARVYWMTRESNAAARRLYDRFGAADDFVRYVVALDAPAGGSCAIGRSR